MWRRISAKAMLVHARGAGRDMLRGVAGNIFTRGRGVPADRDSAAFWYERAALRGTPERSLTLTALRMSAGASGGELTQVFELWLRAAQQGNAEAQRMVEDFCLHGTGTEAPCRGVPLADSRGARGHVPAMVLGEVLMQRRAEDAYQAQGGGRHV